MTVGLGVVAGGLAVIALAAVAADGGRGADEELRRDLQAVARLQVYFGHQSVGANVIEGLGALSARAGVALRVVETPDARAAAGPVFAHGQVGTNGDPRSKLDAFERSLRAGADPDAALVKLCYVDFDAHTDARAVFEAYRTTLRTLRGRHPRTVFVHVTAPLEAARSGVKASLKRLLGRDDPAVAANARREEFNALLRREFEGREPIFDLARVESTRADGRLESVELGGRPVPVLVPEYTSDGGHLNRDGRERAARALVEVLASLPPRGAAASR